MNMLINSVIGGVLVGLGAILFYLSLGKIAGISGIFFGIFNVNFEGWRIIFIAGLLLGALLVIIVMPELATITRPNPGPLAIIVAGFLVGVGTRASNGCTSGHGVCGLGRLSIRSFVAVISFMVTGIFAATFLRHWMGLV
ncbi:YeeE/YedE family protein [Propionivibrio sp.]|uniref:YeeE/YedE family protein n=1 Tax=Propionivibrio sp. TaxID=2212460 RepID=UPI003BF36F70